MYSGAFSDATIVMNHENGLPKIYVLDLFNQHGSQFPINILVPSSNIVVVSAPGVI